MKTKAQAGMIILALFFLIILIFFISDINMPTIENITQNMTFTNTTRSNNSSCSYNNLPYPDFSCTSGQAFSFNDTSVICVKGYTATVRNVSEKLKNEVYAEYGVISHTTGEYEIDHLIPLELGGDNDISNLWAEPSNITNGFHEKDKIENLLHDRFCNGQISLQQAQYDIVYNWTKYI